MQRLNLLPFGGTARSYFNVIELALFFMQNFPQARLVCVDDCRQEVARPQVPSSPSAQGGWRRPQQNRGAPPDTARIAPRDGAQPAQCPEISFLISGPNHYLGAPKALLFWQRMADLPSAAPPPMSYSEDAWPRCNAHARATWDKTTYRPMNKLSIAPLLRW